MRVNIGSSVTAVVAQHSCALSAYRPTDSAQRISLTIKWQSSISSGPKFFPHLTMAMLRQNPPTPADVVTYQYNSKLVYVKPGVDYQVNALLILRFRPLTDNCLRRQSMLPRKNFQSYHIFPETLSSSEYRRTCAVGSNMFAYRKARGRPLLHDC